MRPDLYIGSSKFTTQQLWVYNSESAAMEFREVTYIPGLYNIFDEVIVNAADNKQRDPSMSEIRVTIDRQSGEISVWNNGRGIPVQIHKVCNGISITALWAKLLVANIPAGVACVYSANDFRPLHDLIQLQ